MGGSTQTQFVFEHSRGIGYVTIALGNLLKRWCKKCCVIGVAEHAMLLIDERRRLRVRRVCRGNKERGGCECPKTREKSRCGTVN